MSIEKAKEFLVKVATDEDTGRKADEAYVNALLKVAAEAGYDTNQSELTQALEDMASFGELSETELAQVAGGGIDDSLGTLIVGTLPSSSIGRFLRLRGG